MAEHLQKAEQRILLFSVFVLSLCGIIYELVLGSLATYLLGNPIQQYSITIGFFLSSMGLGSYLSRFLTSNLLRTFVLIEVALGLVGGLSVLVLSFLFSFTTSFYLLHIFSIIIIGTLVGIEIPLLTRILKQYGSLKEILSNVLSLDYLGGLAGSLLFPLLLFPLLGRLLTSITVGIVNIAVGLIIVIRIKYKGRSRLDTLYPILSLIILVVCIYYTDAINSVLNKRLYYDDIVFTKKTKFQEIVLTRNGSDFRLYLDGAIQFATPDEYRYHEMLVLPALQFTGKAKQDILILGGGDGCAVREALKVPSVNRITLVELDPEMIRLAKENSSLRRINKDSLLNKRVRVITDDAYRFLQRSRYRYDAIIADFPDPHDETIAKLYSREFFKLIKRSLKIDGVFLTQSTSPLFAREAFWCINKTLKEVFPKVQPYHVYVPSFGDWGFNIAGNSAFNISSLAPVKHKTQYYSPKTLEHSMHFAADAGYIETEINTFNSPVLYNYYLKGWKNTDY